MKRSGRQKKKPFLTHADVDAPGYEFYASCWYTFLWFCEHVCVFFPLSSPITIDSDKKDSPKKEMVFLETRRKMLDEKKADSTE